jgi:hypothetical protein
LNEVLSSTITQFTLQEDDDLLGRADRISMQLHVTNASGTLPTLTVKLWGSDSRSGGPLAFAGGRSRGTLAEVDGASSARKITDGGKNWVTVTTPWSGLALTVGGVTDAVVDTGSTILPSLLKFEFQLGGTNPSAYVKLSVTGRTD